MKEVKVKKFADVRSSIGAYTHWYEDINGDRFDCSEETMHYLWKKWILSKNTSRVLEPNTNIMIFDKFFKMEINDKK
jgi:hypothetical protein